MRSEKEPLRLQNSAYIFLLKCCRLFLIDNKLSDALRNRQRVGLSRAVERGCKNL